MFVGGEFYYDPAWRVDNPVIATGDMTFLNGGKACLLVISDYLRDQGIDRILLPTYLCPTIVNTLEKNGLACSYYQVKPDLSIDLDNLARKAAAHRAVYFINYFGFTHSQEELALLRGVQQRGLLVVEDNAQAGFSQTTMGDFVFNSMRKLCAYDGGYLKTALEVDPYIEKRKVQPNRRLPLIREYRSRLPDYLFQGKGDRDVLNSLYESAELYYESDPVVEGDADERWQIEHLDWVRIKRVRRENYLYLLSITSDIPELTPLFPDLPEGVMPCGLPVYVSGVPRDWLFDELGNAGIGLTIHWDALLRDPRLNGNPVAVDMAAKMMTLIIDQRVTHKQLEYLALTLRDCIEKYRP